MRRALLILFFIVTQVPVALAVDDESSIKTRLLKLQTDFLDISSVSGNFTQEKYFDFMTEPLLSKGVFYFARPEYLSWSYIEPIWSSLVIEGGKHIAWTGSPSQPIKQPEAVTRLAALAAAQVMVWMKFDLQAILNTYEVERTNDNPLILLVKPKRTGAKKIIKNLEIEFSPDERVVRKVTIEEAESTTVLKFFIPIFNQPRPDL